MARPAVTPRAAAAPAAATTTTSSSELGDVVIETVTPDHSTGTGKKVVLINYRLSNGSAGTSGVYRPNAEAESFAPFNTLVDAFIDMSKVITVGFTAFPYYELQEPYTLAVPQTAGLGLAPLGKEYRGLKTKTHYITPTNLHTSNTHGRKEEA